MCFAPFLRPEISGNNGSLNKILSPRERRGIRLTCAKMIEYLFVCETGQLNVSTIIAYVENAVDILK